MDNVFKMIYWSVSAMIFVLALTIYMKFDKLINERYTELIYHNRYVELYKDNIG